MHSLSSLGDGHGFFAGRVDKSFNLLFSLFCIFLRSALVRCDLAAIEDSQFDQSLQCIHIVTLQ